MSNKSKVKSVGGVVFCVAVGIDNPSVDLFGRQLTAVSPVAALTIHWIVIHYRDCASLTLCTREAELIRHLLVPRKCRVCCKLKAADPKIM